MKYLILLALLLSSPAFAVDPQCVGATQGPTANYADGTIDLCLPEQRDDDSFYPPSETLTCFVTVNGQTLTPAAIGAPGSYHAIPVPEGVYESATVVPGPCIDSTGVTGVAGTPVVASFPAAPAPAAPRPPVLLP